MKKTYKYWLNPGKTMLFMSLTINGRNAGYCSRYLDKPYSVQDNLIIMDVTSHDLEFHSFLRLSHQYIVNKDSVEVSVQDSFELENLNI